jgi:hypothetical protein
MDGTAMVLIEGRATVPWSEGHWRLCPNGCLHRDISRERACGFYRLCLRCLLWTWDLRVADPAMREAALRAMALVEDKARKAYEIERAAKAAKADKEASETRLARVVPRLPASGKTKSPRRPKHVPKY